MIQSILLLGLIKYLTSYTAVTLLHFQYTIIHRHALAFPLPAHDILLIEQNITCYTPACGVVVRRKNRSSTEKIPLDRMPIVN